MPHRLTPAQQALDRAIQSCYRAGWPLPAVVGDRVERFDDESDDDFKARRALTVEVYVAQITDIIERHYQKGTLRTVQALGKLANEDLPQALYLLGETTER